MGLLGSGLLNSDFQPFSTRRGHLKGLLKDLRGEAQHIF